MPTYLSANANKNGNRKDRLTNESTSEDFLYHNQYGHIVKAQHYHKIATVQFWGKNCFSSKSHWAAIQKEQDDDQELPAARFFCA